MHLNISIPCPHTTSVTWTNSDVTQTSAELGALRTPTIGLPFGVRQISHGRGDSGFPNQHLPSALASAEAEALRIQANLYEGSQRGLQNTPLRLTP